MEDATGKEFEEAFPHAGNTAHCPGYERISGLCIWSDLYALGYVSDAIL